MARVAVGVGIGAARPLFCRELAEIGGQAIHAVLLDRRAHQHVEAHQAYARIARRRRIERHDDSPRQAEDLATLVDAIDAEADGVRLAHRRAEIKEAGDRRWVERIDVADARIRVGRLLCQAAAERMTYRGEHRARAGAAAGAHGADDVAHMRLDLRVLVELRPQPMQPAEVRAPVADVAAIAAAERDHHLAAAAVHAPPHMILEPAERTAVAQARRARQAAEPTEPAFPAVRLPATVLWKA